MFDIKWVLHLDRLMRYAFCIHLLNRKCFVVWNLFWNKFLYEWLSPVIFQIKNRKIHGVRYCVQCAYRVCRKSLLFRSFKKECWNAKACNKPSSKPLFNSLAWKHFMNATAHSICLAYWLFKSICRIQCKWLEKKSHFLLVTQFNIPHILECFRFTWFRTRFFLLFCSSVTRGATAATRTASMVKSTLYVELFFDLY